MAVDYTQYVLYKSVDGFPDIAIAPQKYLTIPTSGSSSGVLTDFEYSYDIQVIKIPVPFNPSSQGIMFDLGGVTKVITLEGQRIDSVANLNTFIQNIKGLEGGTTDNATSRGLLTSHQILDNIKFHNPFWNSSGVGTPDVSNVDLTVVITGFKYNYVGGVPSRINYTLTLMESRNFG